MNYAAPIFPMLVIVLPLILGAGVSWWVAIQFVWFSLMFVSIVTVNLIGSKALIFELTKLIPVNVLALLAVLIPTITTPASLGMSTVGAVFTALYSILGLLLLTLVGLGKGNFIAGAFYLFPLIKIDFEFNRNFSSRLFSIIPSTSLKNTTNGIDVSDLRGPGDVFATHLIDFRITFHDFIFSKCKTTSKTNIES